jgi:hypothetical protein
MAIRDRLSSLKGRVVNRIRREKKDEPTPSTTDPVPEKESSDPIGISFMLILSLFSFMLTTSTIWLLGHELRPGHDWSFDSFSRDSIVWIVMVTGFLLLILRERIKDMTFINPVTSGLLLIASCAGSIALFGVFSGIAVTFIIVLVAVLLFGIVQDFVTALGLGLIGLLLLLIFFPLVLLFWIAMKIAQASCD